MEILCIIDSLGSGGAQRQLVQLASEFKKRGHNVSFLTYHDEPFYNYLLEETRIECTCINEANYLKRLLKMRSFIRIGNYDAVLSFLEAPNFIAEAAGFPFRKWKLVVGERNANPHMLKVLRLRFYKWCHFLADHIVANSHTNIQLIKKVNPLLQDSKLKVIYNIIDFNKWKPSPIDTIRSDQFELLVAARHSEQKNAIGLVNALIKMPKEKRDLLRIKWYGDGILPPNNFFLEVSKKVNENGLEENIEFLPATKDIINEIHKSDAVGLFSLYEGFPNVVCEAMACGKAVIASNVSDVPLLLQNKNLLVDPNNIDDIVRGLLHLISMTDEQLKEEGLMNLKKAKETFNAEDIVTQYLKLLTK